MSAATDFRAVTTGRTLWVDTIFGTASGLRQYENISFSTPTAAKAAAQSGDTIVVLPGDYTTTASLAKNGVNWTFLPGATVTFTDGVGSAGAVTGIWDDEGAAMSYRVTGSGVFVRNQGADADTGGFARCIATGHASSDVYIEAFLVSVTTTSDNDSQLFCVLQTAGNLDIRIQNITATGRFTSAMWWVGGNLKGSAGKISASGAAGCITIYGAISAGEFHWQITADHITNTGNGCVVAASSATETAFWVTAQRIQQLSTGPSIWLGGSSKLYVDSQKIYGRIQCDTANAQLYVTSQKLSSVANGTSGDPSLLDLTNGSARINVLQYDVNGTTGETIKVTGGTHEIWGGRLVCGTAKGVEITGGTLRTLGSFLVDTSGSNTQNPVTKSGGVLNMYQTTLVAEATRNAIEAGTAQTVSLMGVFSNTALDGDVTNDITGGLITDAQVS